LSVFSHHTQIWPEGVILSQRTSPWIRAKISHIIKIFFTITAMTRTVLPDKNFQKVQFNSLKPPQLHSYDISTALDNYHRNNCIGCFLTSAVSMNLFQSVSNEYNYSDKQHSHFTQHSTASTVNKIYMHERSQQLSFPVHQLSSQCVKHTSQPESSDEINTVSIKPAHAECT